MPIKVLIADDHTLLRQGIKGVLDFESDIQVVGEAEDGQETLAKTLMLQPDILLLDLNMPGTTGIEVCKKLVEAKCKTRIIALTIHDNDNYVIELMKNGAYGYLLKGVEPNVLLEAIHIVAEGGFYVLPELRKRIFGNVKPNDNVQEMAKEIWREGRNERLTARELDVIACIGKGFSNQDIAQALFVSEKTVKNHLTNIFRKLNVKDRTQALIYAIKHDMLTLD